MNIRETIVANRRNRIPREGYAVDDICRGEDAHGAAHGADDLVLLHRPADQIERGF